mmetsp:Transcript_12444/g.40996  ORF Transcript_12444/g.40996 Transcript_12444/m.40996 type:complete len:274 (-) Transcript_12444:235-1056(-)
MVAGSMKADPWVGAARLAKVELQKPELRELRPVSLPVYIVSSLAPGEKEVLVTLAVGQSPFPLSFVSQPRPAFTAYPEWFDGRCVLNMTAPFTDVSVGCFMVHVLVGMVGNLGCVRCPCSTGSFTLMSASLAGCIAGVVYGRGAVPTDERKEGLTPGLYVCTATARAGSSGRRHTSCVCETLSLVVKGPSGASFLRFKVATGSFGPSVTTGGRKLGCTFAMKPSLYVSISRVSGAILSTGKKGFRVCTAACDVEKSRGASIELRDRGGMLLRP